MDFFNIPVPPSHEYIQDKHMHAQEELLNEIKAAQYEQLNILNKMQADSKKESKFNRIGFFVALFVAIVAAIGAWIPLLF